MKWFVTFLLLDLLMWASTVNGEDEPRPLPAFASSSKSKNGEVRRRSKRSLMNFHTVIQCFQPWADVLAAYSDYGCYCGYRGYGRPLDDTDKCCYNHDNCYEDAQRKASGFSDWSMGTYFTSYHFHCTENNTVACNEELNNEYQHAVCECDREAAECFLVNRKSYSEKLFDINVNKYCKEKADFNDFQLNTHTLSKLYTCVLKPDQDKCCVEKGYNSVYEICCDGNLARLPSALRENYDCCNGKVYDNRKQICCYGALHPNFPHFRCCGNSGAKVDTTNARCVDGEVVLLPSYNETSNTTDVH